MYCRLFFFGKGEKKGQNVSQVAGNAYGKPMSSPPYVSQPPDFCEKKKLSRRGLRTKKHGNPAKKSATKLSKKKDLITHACTHIYMHTYTCTLGYM